MMMLAGRRAQLSFLVFHPGGIRPVWGLNGRVETKSRAVSHFFLKIAVYADIKDQLKKAWRSLGNVYKGKAYSEAAKQILVFTREHFYSPQIDFSCVSGQGYMEQFEQPGLQHPCVGKKNNLGVLFKTLTT